MTTTVAGLTDLAYAAARCNRTASSWWPVARGRRAADPDVGIVRYQSDGTLDQDSVIAESS